MNKLTIIGNLTRDPELRTTSSGVDVCTFTVAVNNRRNPNGDAQFFRVSAWRELGKNCQKFLTKGRKVCVVGPVDVRTFTTNNGEFRANLEVTAEDVEFLSSKNENTSDPAPEAPATNAPAGFTQVAMDEELPF